MLTMKTTFGCFLLLLSVAVEGLKKGREAKVPQMIELIPNSSG